VGYNTGKKRKFWRVESYRVTIGLFFPATKQNGKVNGGHQGDGEPKVNIKRFNAGQKKAAKAGNEIMGGEKKNCLGEGEMDTQNFDKGVRKRQRKAKTDDIQLRSWGREKKKLLFTQIRDFPRAGGGDRLGSLRSGRRTGRKQWEDAIGVAEA